MTTSLLGQLLVASPVQVEDTFARSVVLVLSHDDDGALGVVLDRPTEVPVASVLPAWSDLLTDPDVLFHGGPVGPDSALGLVSLRADDEPPGVRRVSGGLAVVDLDAPPEVIRSGVAAMRVFAGYAGWSSGQLDREIADGAWYVLDGLPTDVFGRSDGELWRDVLRRQGWPLAQLSTFPAEPEQN